VDALSEGKELVFGLAVIAASFVIAVRLAETALDRSRGGLTPTRT